MNFKSKYEIGSLVKYKSDSKTVIGEITSIEFAKEWVKYYFCFGESHCLEEEVLENYALIAKKKKRAPRIKKGVDVIV